MKKTNKTKKTVGNDSNTMKCEFCVRYDGDKRVFRRSFRIERIKEKISIACLYNGLYSSVEIDEFRRELFDFVWADEKFSKRFFRNLFCKNCEIKYKSWFCLEDGKIVE